MSAALERVAAAPGARVILFDFDGVLVRGDSFSLFLRERARRQPWRAALLLPLLPLAPLGAHQKGRRLLVRLAVRVLLLGMGSEHYQALAESHARVRALRRGCFIRDAVSAMRRHLLRGDRVVVVTGCEEYLARSLLESIGLDGIELVASRLREGRLGLVPEVHNVGSEKLRQLVARGINPPWACAYSNASVDLPMLAAAESAVLVNPSEILRMHMQAQLGERYAEADWV